MRTLFTIVILSFIIACSQTTETTTPAITSNKLTDTANLKIAIPNELVHQSTIDTSNLKIAIPDKLAYQSTIDTPNHLVNLELFYYENNKWKTLQTIDSIKSQFGNDSLEIMDFNFDEIMDFRIQTGTAGRGANLYYNVFIFDINENQYIKVENDIPNIYPKKSLQVISGTRFVGDSTITRFYDLDNYKLYDSNKKMISESFLKVRDKKVFDKNGNIIKHEIDTVEYRKKDFN